MAKFLDENEQSQQEPEPERVRFVMYIEPVYATLYVGKQNPLLVDDTAYVDDLVVEIGRSQFFFEVDSVTLELNSQVEREINSGLGGNYINLALPRSLSYAAHSNTINRQQVYQWLTRMTRRSRKKLKNEERERVIAVKALNEAAMRRAMNPAPTDTGNMEVVAEVLDVKGVVVDHTTVVIEQQEVMNAVSA